MLDSYFIFLIISILWLINDSILPSAVNLMKKPQTLSVPLERITWEGLEIPVLLEADWFARWLQEEPGLEFTLATPIQGSVRLERHDGNILLRGHLQGDLACTCSRCLDIYAQPLATQFEMLIKVGGLPDREAEVELSAADLDEEYCPGDSLDLDTFLREQILLALPLKPLCQDECLGLCRRCGANLNREACTCQVPATNSPMAALAHLKKEKKSS